MSTQFTAFFATAAIIFGVVGPIAADPLEVAINHFNASADNVSERLVYAPTTGQEVTFSAQGNSPFDRAITILNRSADNVGEMIGTQGVTVFGGTPAYGAEIFEQMRLQDDN